MKRVAIYARVSTEDQTTDNQLLVLRDLVEKRGWVVSKEFIDVVSGSKTSRKEYDALKASIQRNQVDIVVVWAIDRLGRNTEEALSFVNLLNHCNVGLYIHQQNIDATGPMGKLIYSVFAAFAEFERAILIDRINAGIARARIKGTKSGKPIGRPKVSEDIVQKIKAAKENGASIRTIAREVGVSVGKVAGVLAS